MHPAVIHSAERKHTPVKCCNNTSRLINQAQMHKTFPRGFWGKQTVQSHGCFLAAKSLPQITKQLAWRQFRTLHFDLIWLMSLGIVHFVRLCLLNLCNQCELCLRLLHTAMLQGPLCLLGPEMALFRHHDSLISCFPHLCCFTTGLCVAVPH